MLWLLHSICFCREGVDDKWDLHLDPSKGYTIHEVYNMLTNVD